MINLSLSMIVKNEEEDLPGCLDSVKGAADEIILVDTGSTDKTIEIAKKYGAKIFNFEWIKDFSAARNFALSKSSGRWILYLDADERLSTQSVSELKKIIAGDSKTGVYCNVNSINQVGSESGTMQYIRLFKNSPGIEFTGKVHEQIDRSLIKNGYNIVTSDIEIIHTGYSADPVILKEKALRNFELLTEQYKSKPDSYTAFQLGQTLIIIDRKEESTDYFKKAADDKNFEISHRAHAYRYLAAIALENGNINDAEENIQKAVSLNPEMPLVNIVAANVYQRTGDKTKAADHCKTAFQMNRSLLKGEKKAYFDIMLNETELFNFGINLSVLLRNKELMNWFYSFKDTVKLNENQLYSIELFYKLLNLQEFQEDFINKFEPSKFNPAIIVALSGYNPKLKIQMLVKIINEYPDDLIMKKALADELSVNGLKNEALEIYYEIFGKTQDISILLDIINVLTEIGDYAELLKFITETENKLDAYPQIKGKIEKIKENLSEQI